MYLRMAYVQLRFCEISKKSIVRIGMTIPQEAIDIAIAKSKADEAYHSAVQGILQAQKPMEMDEFWRVIEVFVNRTGLTTRGVVSGCHNLMCYEVGRDVQKYVQRWLRICSFAVRYRQARAALGKKLGDFRGLERSGYSFEDLIDSLPLAGREVFEGIFANDIANYKQLKKAIPESLRSFILDGKNYIEMTLEDKISKSFMWFAQELSDYTPEHKVKDPCVVLVGSPMSGFTVVGPFDTRQEAVDWTNGCDVDTCLMPLRKPEISDF
jgi:hypothetical protein